VSNHRHFFRVKGRTDMGWQFVMSCECGVTRYPSVELFGAVRIAPAFLRKKVLS
jgi:hypothetical protein